MKKKNKQKGITLIALIITIIILLILAGISIVSLNESGLFEKALTAKEKQKIAEYQEAIKLGQAQAILENYETRETKTILAKIRDILKEEELFKGSTFVIEDEILKITTSEKYVFEVTQDNVLYIGKVGEIAPKISLSDISSTSNSITIEIETEIGDSDSIKYYIKSENDKEYNLEETTKNLKCTYKNLTQDMTYNIKVVVETPNGSSELGPINQKTGTVDIATGNIKFSTEYWSNGKATIYLSTSTSYNIQYQINEINDNGWKATKTVNGLNNGDIVYARLWDGKNGGEMASKTISDSINPSTSIGFSSHRAYMPNSITVHVNQSDNQSGLNIQKCKWVLNKSNKLLGTEDDSVYTETFNSATEDLTLNVTEEGTYYLHVLTVDNANNKSERISSKIEFIESSSPGLTATNYGDKINYFEESNGVTLDDWKVFYKDKETDSVYIIYGSVLPMDAISLGGFEFDGQCVEQKGMGFYWDKQIFNNLYGNEVDLKDRALSTLSMFQEVSLDMMINSWNEKGYKKLYKHKDSYDNCWVNFTENSENRFDSDSSFHDIEKDSLYFVSDEMMTTYWLGGEKPYSNSDIDMLFAFSTSSGLIDAEDITMDGIGLRPVRELSHGNKLTQQDDGSWNIK